MIQYTRCNITKNDMVLIAMPSFGGCAPAVAIERLKRIRGNGAKCTLVCVYGNRAYEDTLVEMEDAAKKSGFQVIAFIAAVAEHSIISQYASNKPDASDEKQLVNFADQIADKDGGATSIPGNRPYKKSGGAGLVPRPNKDCVRFGLCAERCPVQAINPTNFRTDSKKCISCMRCVKQCRANARKVNGAMVSIAAMQLKRHVRPEKKMNYFCNGNTSFHLK